MKTSKKANVVNKAIKSEVNTYSKKVLNADSSESASAALARAYSVIDKAAKRGILNRNNAANRKSRLSRAVQKLAS
jgi:small subunit ribosomal protein S20